MTGKQIMIAVAAVMASGVAELLLLGGQHGHGWWAQVPGFFSLFGFFVCLMLILVGKGLGSLWLQRPDDYYDREARDD
jgi:hypothetical protein